MRVFSGGVLTMYPDWFPARSKMEPSLIPLGNGGGAGTGLTPTIALYTGMRYIEKV